MTRTPTRKARSSSFLSLLTIVVYYVCCILILLTVFPSCITASSKKSKPKAFSSSSKAFPSVSTTQSTATVTSSWTYKCPCVCDMDDFTRKRVLCNEIKLTSIPTPDMDRNTQVILSILFWMKMLTCYPKGSRCLWNSWSSSRPHHRPYFPRVWHPRGGDHHICISPCHRWLVLLARQEDPFPESQSQPNLFSQRKWFHWFSFSGWSQSLGQSHLLCSVCCLSKAHKPDYIKSFQEQVDKIGSANVL